MINRVFLIISIISCCIRISVFAQDPLPAHPPGDFIRYIKLPADITRADLFSGSKSVRQALDRQLKSEIPFAFRKDSLYRNMDLVIVYVDHDGTPILPDREKKAEQITNPSDISSNELSFTFNSPDQPWRADEFNKLYSYIRDIYPAIKNLMGPPLFDITINVRKDSTMYYGGLYFSSINEMTLYTVETGNHFCHESIHAMRDDYIMGVSVYEEGMTRAAEVEVFNQLPDYEHFDEGHNYLVDVYYEGHNRPNIACHMGYLLSNMTLDLHRYQISSYVWAKAFFEDNNFFKRFNDTLVARILIDPFTMYNELPLRSIFETITPLIEGLPNAAWSERQFILNFHPADGYFLYQRMSQSTIVYFKRENINFVELPQPYETVYWQIFDHNNVLIDHGSDITAPYGWIEFNANVPYIYNGRTKIVASVQSPDGFITDTVYRIEMPMGIHGVFGVVEDANTGSISVTPLDTALDSQQMNLINGAFSFPDFENIRGRFRFEVIYPDNSRASRIFSKDKGRYYLLAKKETSAGLPVTWVSFTGAYKNNAAVLQWQTASEQNSAYFNIQRSISNGVFTTIGRVPAAGNSSMPLQYNFSDNQAAQAGASVLYYRIQQKDIDGKAIYSKIISLSITAKKSEMVIAPNPAGNNITIRLKSGGANSKGLLSIFDMSGRRQLMQTITLNNGNNSFPVSVIQLSPGLYYVLVEWGETRWRSKLIKQ